MSGPELGGPGQRLCPSCARFGPESAQACKHCGYNFESGSNPSWQGAPILADAPERDAASSVPTAATRRHWPGRAIAAVILIVVVAAFVGPILTLFDSATELIQDLPGQIDVDVPDISIPDINTDVGPFGGDAGSYDKCHDRITKYIRRMLANDGSGSRPLNELFIQASVKLGAGSFEYRTLVSVFSQNQGTAISQGTRAGVRGAERDAKKACRQHYRS